jgi:hypothetical protein
MIPPALTRALRTPPLAPDQFVATKWNSAKDKADYGNRLLAFVSKDFPKASFSRSFYQRLSNTFGQIAHYNRHQFHEHCFESTADKISFLRQTLTHPCYGDPLYTFSDVERAIITRLRHSRILEVYEARLDIEAMAAERAMLARLNAKYETIPAPPPLPIQADLFDLSI